MNAIAEARELAREIGGHGPWTVRVRRVQRVLYSTFNRAKDVYYGDRRIRIDAIEIDRLRAKTRTDERARIEADEDRARIAGLRDALASIDEDFHGPTIEALDRALRTLGGVD